MMRQFKIVLEEDSVKRIAADQDQADLFDKLMESINALNACNERDGAPARLRVLNKEPKRHRKRSVASSADNSESDDNNMNSSSGGATNSSATDDDQEPGVQLWISSRRGRRGRRNRTNGRRAPTWDKVIEDKAKMIEMHAF